MELLRRRKNIKRTNVFLVVALVVPAFAQQTLSSITSASQVKGCIYSDPKACATVMDWLVALPQHEGCIYSDPKACEKKAEQKPVAICINIGGCLEQQLTPAVVSQQPEQKSLDPAVAWWVLSGGTNSPQRAVEPVNPAHTSPITVLPVNPQTHQFGPPRVQPPVRK